MPTRNPDETNQVTAPADPAPEPSEEQELEEDLFLDGQPVDPLRWLFGTLFPVVWTQS